MSLKKMTPEKVAALFRALPEKNRLRTMGAQAGFEALARDRGVESPAEDISPGQWVIASMLALARVAPEGAGDEFFAEAEEWSGGKFGKAASLRKAVEFVTPLARKVETQKAVWAVNKRHNEHNDHLIAQGKASRYPTSREEQEKEDQSEQEAKARNARLDELAPFFPDTVKQVRNPRTYVRSREAFHVEMKERKRAGRGVEDIEIDPTLLRELEQERKEYVDPKTVMEHHLKQIVVEPGDRDAD